MKETEDHVRHLDQDVVGLQATQDSLKGTLAMKEKLTQQLVQDNAQLKESQALLQSKVGNTRAHTHSHTLRGGELFLNKEQNWATFSKSNPVRYIGEFSSFFTSFTVNHPSFFPSSSAFPLSPSLHI